MMRRGGLRPTAPCRAERAAPPNPELERTAQSLRERMGNLTGPAAPGGTCQQLWDTRELHLVSLDYGGETREVGAIDINIDQDLVA